MDKPDAEPALRNHLMMQEEFVAYSMTDERSCET